MKYEEMPAHTDICHHCGALGVVQFGIVIIPCPRCSGTGVFVEWREVEKEVEEIE